MPVACNTVRYISSKEMSNRLFLTYYINNLYSDWFTFIVAAKENKESFLSVLHILSVLFLLYETC